MRNCRNCGVIVTKELFEKYKLNLCMDCLREKWRIRNRKKKNVDYFKKYWKKWYKKNKEEHSKNGAKYAKESNKKYFYKQKARKKLTNAVTKGSIKKPSKCTVCKKPYIKSKIEGHHPDYSKALNVIWVCRMCHKTFHKTPLA